MFNLGNMTREQIVAKEAEMRALGARHDIFDLLARSIAPKVFHLDSVKAGALCLLFGGCPKAFPGACFFALGCVIFSFGKPVFPL